MVGRACCTYGIYTSYIYIMQGAQSVSDAVGFMMQHHPAVSPRKGHALWRGVAARSAASIVSADATGGGGGSAGAQGQGVGGDTSVLETRVGEVEYKITEMGGQMEQMMGVLQRIERKIDRGGSSSGGGDAAASQE
jgi:hypothetical protein